MTYGVNTHFNVSTRCIYTARISDIFRFFRVEYHRNIYRSQSIHLFVRTKTCKAPNWPFSKFLYLWRALLPFFWLIAKNTRRTHIIKDKATLIDSSVLTTIEWLVYTITEKLRYNFIDSRQRTHKANTAAVDDLSSIFKAYWMLRKSPFVIKLQDEENTKTTAPKYRPALFHSTLSFGSSFRAFDEPLQFNNERERVRVEVRVEVG